MPKKYPALLAQKIGEKNGQNPFRAILRQKKEEKKVACTTSREDETLVVRPHVGLPLVHYILVKVTYSKLSVSFRVIQAKL